MIRSTAWGLAGFGDAGLPPEELAARPGITNRCPGWITLVSANPLAASNDLGDTPRRPAIPSNESPGRTVYLPCRADRGYISSRFVREIARYGGSITHMVPPCVADALHEQFPPDEAR